tara:strand:+ start:4774 stop:5637 length:864 start_codon:yes stop_codon:yes gene_type:complete
LKADPRAPDDSVNLTPTHWLREATTLTGGLTVFALLGFTAIAFLVNLLVPVIPLHIEAQVTKAIWEEVQDYVPEGSEDTVARLDSLVNELANHWPDREYDFRVAVVEAGSPNAFALPGGLIIVTTDLIRIAASENELAFVLGHELGHFHNRDHLKALGRGILFDLALASIGMGPGSISGLFGNAGLLTSRSFNRRQERTADRFGLELMYEQYGTVAGSLDFFRHDLGATGMSETIADFAGTHPGSATRIEELIDFAGEKGWPLDGELLPPVFKKLTLSDSTKAGASK